MGAQVDEKVNPFRVGVVLAVAIGGLAWWRWPDIVTWKEQSDLEAAKEAKDLKFVADLQAKARVELGAIQARAKSVGLKGVLDPLLAKKRLNGTEHSELGTAASLYALELTGVGPSTVTSDIVYDDNGNVKSVKGHEAYFAKIYKKEIEDYDIDPPAPATPAPAATTPAYVPSPAPVAASWHTVAHYTGQGIKDTPTFTASSDEWRIRWKYTGRAGLAIFAYGGGGPGQLVANTQGADSDESYIHGAGDYYLHISAVGRYDVWVESR